MQGWIDYNLKLSIRQVPLSFPDLRCGMSVIHQALLLSSIVNVSMGPLLRALMSFKRLVGVKMCEDPGLKAKRSKHQKWQIISRRLQEVEQIRDKWWFHQLSDLTDDDLAGFYSLVDLISSAHLRKADPSKNKDDEAGAWATVILGYFAFLSSAVEDRTRQFNTRISEWKWPRQNNVTNRKESTVPDSAWTVPGCRTLRLVRPVFSIQFVLHSILKGKVIISFVETNIFKVWNVSNVNLIYNTGVCVQSHICETIVVVTQQSPYYKKGLCCWMTRLTPTRKPHNETIHCHCRLCHDLFCTPCLNKTACDITFV